MLVSNRVRSCAAAFGVMIAASPAFAADYYGGNPGGGYKDPPVAVYVPNWAGFYLGPSFGWSWSSINVGNNTIVIGNNGSVPFSSPGTSGMIGGAQLGYNMQAGNFVYGIELDFGGLDTSGTGTRVDPYDARRVGTVKSTGGFYGDVTGRAGLTVGPAMLYAKGGFAYFTGNVQVTDAFDGIFQNSGVLTGWTVGGGLEYKLTRTLTMKGEYQYFDMANSNFSCCLAATPGRVDETITANTFRLGLNFYLNDLRSPLE